MAVFEPFPSPIWCKSHSPALFHYFHDSPPPSPFYDVPIHFMAGPTRTESSNHRANPLPGSSNPPRPPNAWILYRSEKLKDLPPPPPGMPRRPQADISKTISAMWKTEPAEVRSHYERLSDIKKAEHQAKFPNYRFQPMKKADKDRLKAEKQAEKERERGTRKSKGRTRVGAGQEPTPLYTTEARFGPAGPSPPASGASTPPVGQASSLPQPAAASHPTPPPDRSTFSAGHPPTPVPPPSTPSSYPPPPSSTLIPPLVAPQPGVPQRPPSASDWQQNGQPQSSEQGFNSMWIDQASLPDMSEYAASQEYLTVPLPNHPQHPLGWSPDDPTPVAETPWNDPLHAVLSATDDPDVFNLNDFDVNQLFDGSREIEVSMGSDMMPPAFLDMNQYNAYTNSLFFDLDTQPPFAPPDLSTFASTSTGQQEPSGLPAPFMSSDPVQRTDVTEQLAAYTFDGALFDERDFSNTTSHVSLNSPHPHDTQEQSSTPMAQEPPRMPPPAPYVPPAGASNTTRRVAADWRHIRLTPEPEPWTGQGR